MLKIGDVKLESDILLAPMAGITDAAYRRLIRELGGCGLMYTEMVSAKGLCYGDKKSFALTYLNEFERPAAIQLFGSEPEYIAHAIELLDDSCADLFDINMGCPMRKITGNGEGCALMLDGARAESIIRTAVKVSSKPVTVKIRKGWDETNVNAVEFAKRMEGAGAAAVAVHGRTRAQMYSGKADWDVIAQVKNAVKIPVIGNGDVFTPRDALKMLDICDGAMVGRAVRGNPWIFQDIEIARGRGGEGWVSGAEGREGGAEGWKNSTEAQVYGAEHRQYNNDSKILRDSAERYKTILRHFEYCIGTLGDHVGVLEMRKHLAWYVKGMSGACAIKRDIFRMTGPDEIVRYIERLAGTGNE